jgi:hypothetical protein
MPSASSFTRIARSGKEEEMPMQSRKAGRKENRRKCREMQIQESEYGT